MIDESTRERIDTVRKTHEFLTFMSVKTSDDIKCGVVQNCNTRFISYYDIDKIKNEKHRELFIQLADKWWWQSGRELPIAYFIGPDFDMFQHALVTISKKTLTTDPIGPIYSITENYLKRVKKKRIDLVSRKTPQ